MLLKLHRNLDQMVLRTFLFVHNLHASLQSSQSGRTVKEPLARPGAFKWSGHFLWYRIFGKAQKLSVCHKLVKCYGNLQEKKSAHLASSNIGNTHLHLFSLDQGPQTVHVCTSWSSIRCQVGSPVRPLTLGWASPYVIHSKFIPQCTWSHGLDWEDQLQEDMNLEWAKRQEEMGALKSFTACLFSIIISTVFQVRHFLDSCLLWCLRRHLCNYVQATSTERETVHHLLIANKDTTFALEDEFHTSRGVNGLSVSCAPYKERLWEAGFEHEWRQVFQRLYCSVLVDSWRAQKLSSICCQPSGWGADWKYANTMASCAYKSEYCRYDYQRSAGKQHQGSRVWNCSSTTTQNVWLMTYQYLHPQQTRLNWRKTCWRSNRD